MSQKAWEHYHTTVWNMIGTPHTPVTLLKTDVYNEIKNKPQTNGITGNTPPHFNTIQIDIKEDYVEQYNTTYPCQHAYTMDIRNLKFQPLTFDYLFDLSTIDHVPTKDVEQVLLEYHKVLKYNGQGIIISWTHPTKEGMGEQFYHPHTLLIELLERYFTITHINTDIILSFEGAELTEYQIQKEV
jgi:SAM-dependent methyltransferase